MSNPLCVRCERPTPDGYGCVACAVDLPRRLLAEIRDMLPAARDIAQRQARYGGGGGASGKPGSSLPLDLGATARLDAVQNALTTRARDVAEERGVPVELTQRAAEAISGLGGSPGGGSDLRGRKIALMTLDPIAVAAAWLAAHCEWMRHRPDVAGWLDEVEACARVVRSIARGPGEQRYLGPCGAPVPQPPEGEPDLPCCVATDCAPHGAPCCNHGDPVNCPADPYVGDVPCTGDVYGYVGAEQGRCRTCGASVSQGERRVWLDGEVRAHAFRAAHIADAYGVNVNTIRTWATRPRPDTGRPPLASYWRTDAGLVAPWIEPPAEATAKERTAIEAARGPRLHYVADVLDLAAAEAARRETERAKRERRAAARAESERLSA